jgi:hypothetical protein
MAWKVTVAAGGRAGTVRGRFKNSDTGAIVLGDPVTLPAEPGTYTFPAPRLYGSVIGLVQTVGGHAIVDREACQPTAPRYADPCETGWVTVARDGQADERLAGAQLTISGAYEPDVDRDLLGDISEDHTDLRLTVSPKRAANGRVMTAVTVTNAGPLVANGPRIDAKDLPLGTWWGDCLPHMSFPVCAMTPLGPGESRTVIVVSDWTETASPSFTVTSEGADLAPADNTVTAALSAAPAFDLVAAPSQRLSQGVKVQVRGVHAGRARVTVAFKVRGKTIKVGRIVKLAPFTARTVTIRPAGAKLRSLRRHAPLDAEITVRTFSGKTPVTAKTRVV